MRKILNVGDLVKIKREYLVNMNALSRDAIYQIYKVDLLTENEYDVLLYDVLCEKLNIYPNSKLHAAALYSIKDIKNTSNHLFYDFRVDHCDENGLIYNQHYFIRNDKISIF